MAISEKEICRKELYAAGDLEKETELLQKEISTADITNQTPLFTIFCC